MIGYWGNLKSSVTDLKMLDLKLNRENTENPHNKNGLKNFKVENGVLQINKDFNVNIVDVFLSKTIDFEIANFHFFIVKIHFN